MDAKIKEIIQARIKKLGIFITNQKPTKSIKAPKTKPIDTRDVEKGVADILKKKETDIKNRINLPKDIKKNPKIIKDIKENLEKIRSEESD